MFGTVARMRVKQGMGPALDDLSKQFESRHVDGWRRCAHGSHTLIR